MNSEHSIGAVRLLLPAVWVPDPREVDLGVQQLRLVDNLFRTLVVVRRPLSDGLLSTQVHELLMRYVGNGEPERMPNIAKPMEAERFQWTDGVRRIDTWFYALPDKHLYEFHYMRSFTEEGVVPAGDAEAMEAILDGITFEQTVVD